MSMNNITQVKEYLSKIPEGQAIATNDFRSFATTENIRQILGRLAKSGELRRVGRGVFVKPKHLPKIGEVLPSLTEMAQKISQTTGETIVVQAAEAARQLQLTTQVPMQTIFYTNGNTRTLKLANQTVKLKHVNPSKLIAPGTISGLVISALDYVGKDNVTTKTIATIQQRIPAEDFQTTLALIKQMPAWLADIFYRFQQEQQHD